MGRNKLPSNSSELFKRFSRPGSISSYEKELSSAQSVSIPLFMIDDNPFTKHAEIAPEIVERFAESVARKGVFVPLVVRKNTMRYEIVFGRKRYYSARRLKHNDVPCYVIDADDEKALLMLLADIRDQKDSSIVEFAYVFKALSEDYGYSQADLATISHQSRSQVTNTMRLLKLPDSILQQVSRGELSYGHARAVETLDEKNQFLAVSLIHDGNLSVRDTEALAKKLLSNPNALDRPDDEVLKEKFDSEIVIINGKNVVFSFASDKERDAFIERLKKL
ncbi:MAG: ParB/RepB/Spo0J family partition protein [Bacilli bacterium]|nr:ParB/RepB/Spo0J family partition protein [Bacilli bacterium]